jgi:bifunctional UDP-N-acetylglucosamine pyrophosphorylase/glucosamine-1-phosphate N-acetyltransferase
MKAIVLAAGGGANLSPFSLTKPKAMAQVAGRPILHRTLSMLRESGFSEVYMVIGHDGKSITDYFGAGRDMGMTIGYLTQKRPTGIGDAVLAAKGKFVPGDHFLLVYSDVIAEENMASSVMQAFFLAGMPSASICLTEKPGDFGNVYLDGAMNITKIVEKPGDKGMGNYVLAGLYVLPYSFFGILEKCGGDMARGLASLIKSGGLKGSIWEKGWLDVVYPWDILTANRMAMDKWHFSEAHESIKVRDAHIKGPVHIEEDVEIRSGAVIEGPAFIGRGSYIGNNALIRKYSSVGAGCVVGFGVELKNCVLCDGANVGRLSFIGDSVIGERAVIGSGTMTINSKIDGSTIKVKMRKGYMDSGTTKLGAFVGDGANIGSGHNIAPGSVIAPGVFVEHHLTYPGRGGR